jgi:hypothetical protein
MSAGMFYMFAALVACVLVTQLIPDNLSAYLPDRQIVLLSLWGAAIVLLVRICRRLPLLGWFVVGLLRGMLGGR